jgi:hypothetical protein
MITTDARTRKRDYDTCAARLARFDADVTSVCLDDALAEIEAQPVTATVAA